MGTMRKTVGDEEKSISRLHKQLTRALKSARNYQEEAEKFKKLFTAAQCERLLTGKKNPWSSEDISNAIRLRSHGPRAFDILRGIWSPFSISVNCSKMDCKGGSQRGFLCPVLEHLNENLNSDWECVCVISIDEMKVERAFQYLKDWQRVVIPSEYCQVIMVRGLCSKCTNRCFTLISG